MSEGFVDGSFTDFNDRDLAEARVKKNYSQHLLAE
jgi:hypothetical protein